MKIGFIGAGNMGHAIMGGILSKGLVSKEDVVAADLSEEIRKSVSDELGIKMTADKKEVAGAVDVLFLAVKPIYGEAVINDIKDVIKAETVVVSIMAGRNLAWLKERLGADKKIVRTMPNTPALVLEAMTAICPGENVSNSELASVLEIFGSFGKASVVNENIMDAVTAVSGSSPAYVFMFIEAMADAAVKEGMARKDAYTFAAQAVLGSAKMVLEMGKHPGELKDMVCSPAGTTIDAVKVLEEKGFRGAVMEAMHQCAEKSRTI